MNGWCAELYTLLDRWEDVGLSEAARAIFSSCNSWDAISSVEGGGQR